MANWHSIYDPSEKGFVSHVTTLGVGLGISLVFTSLVLDIYLRDLSYTLSGIWDTYNSNPIHWIILSSPFLLGIIFFSFSRMVSQRKNELSEKMETEKKISTNINRQINNLIKGVFAIDQASDESEASKNLEILRAALEDQHEVEQKRKWTSEGIALFSEVLRQHNSIEELSYHFLQSLVKYIKFNQGGVFLAVEGGQQQTTLELKACYAYERKKFVRKSYDTGEGLVGQCFMERNPILLYEIPQNYIQITSGLGEAPPHCIVLFPLQTQESIEGIIELAGFRKLQEFEMEFLTLVCGNFASVLRNAALAENTSRLLEITRQQAEALKLKEAEMKQNLKDMEETMLEMLKNSSAEGS